MSKYPQETCPSGISFTDDGNHNKDTKPPWFDFFLDSEVQPNQKLCSVRGLQVLNGKLNFYKYSSLQNIFGMLSYWQEYNVEILWEMLPLKKYAAQTQ